MMDDRLRQTRLRLLAADRELQALRVSHSWWLTHPLRAAERRFPAATRGAMQAVKAAAWALGGQLPARLRGQRATPTDPPATSDAPPGRFDLPEGGRRILIADARVPQPDRDAGSRTTLAIIDTLRAEGWGVAFWPHERGYAGQYAEALAARGVPVIDGRFPGSLADWLAEHGATLDHALLMRPRPADALLDDLLRHSAARLSYYGHDLHGVRLRREAALRRDPFIADTAERELAIERRVWRAVDVVLYPSEAEATFVRTAEPGVDARTLPPFAFAAFPAPPAPPPSGTLLFVGGFGHAPNTDAVQWFAQAVLPLVLARRPDAKLCVAGGAPTPSLRALAGPAVEIAGWLTDEALAARYAATRVVVAPLRYGAGVKGKVVDALHLGRPLVTTSIGAEGLPGLAAVVPVTDDAPGLAAAIVALLADDAAWAAQAAGQIAYAKAHCSQAVLRAALLGALEGS